MNLFNKFKIGLGKSSSDLSEGFTNIFSKKNINDSVLSEFEDLLISSDTGVEVAKQLRKDFESFKKDATRVAQAAVPQALVSPAPRSQTLTEISFLELTCAKVTLHFSGKISWLSIFGPIVLMSRLKQSSIKKIMCGLPTFKA